MIMNEPVLIDTGPLIAIYNKDDDFYGPCRKQLGAASVGQVLHVLAGRHRSRLHVA